MRRQTGIGLLIFAVLVGILVVGAVRFKNRPQFPRLLNDLSTFEYEKLKAAATSPDSKNVTAIALSTAEPIHSRIYVSSNFKDGTVLNLDIREVPGTVIAPLPRPIPPVALSPLRGHLTLYSSFGLSPGQYDVKVLSPSGAELAERQLFLGGVEDGNYKQKLGTAKVNRQLEASNELKELNADFVLFKTNQALLEKLFKLASSSSPNIKQVKQLEAQWKTIEAPRRDRDLTRAYYQKPLSQIQKLVLEMNGVKGLAQDYFAVPPRQLPLQTLRDLADRFNSDLASWKDEADQLTRSFKE